MQGLGWSVQGKPNDHISLTARPNLVACHLDTTRAVRGPFLLGNHMSYLPRGNATDFKVLSVTLSPAQVSANPTAEQTFTVNGVQANDVVLSINKPTAQAGLGIVGWRVSAANTVGITFSNNTGGGITPTASQAYKIVVIRPENGASLPAAIV